MWEDKRRKNMRTSRCDDDGHGRVIVRSRSNQQAAAGKKVRSRSREEELIAFMHNYFTPYRSLLQHQNTLSLFSYYTHLSHSAFRLASCKLPCSSPKLWRYHIHQIVTVHLISHSFHSIPMRWDRDHRDGLPCSDENGNNNCKVLETREISFLMLINPIHMCTHHNTTRSVHQTTSRQSALFASIYMPRICRMRCKFCLFKIQVIVDARLSSAPSSSS